jgi:hypothetical protein
MCTIALKVIITLLMEAHAELRITPLPDGSVDNTTLHVLGMPGQQQVRYTLRAPQQPVHQMPSGPYQMFPYKHIRGSSNVATQSQTSDKEGSKTFDWLFQGGGEGNFKSKEELDAVGSVDASKVVNAFGESVQPCKVPDYCLFDKKSPKVCAHFLEDGSDDRCISIFEYSKANKWRKDWTQEPISEKYTERAIPGMNFPQIPVKCDAVPSAVLDSQFSLEMWSSCEIKYKEYKYVSPKSSQSGGEQSKVVNKSPFVIDKPSLKEINPADIASKCDRFRDAIRSICDVCSSVAGNDAAKAALSGKCDAIQGDGAPGEALDAQTSSVAFGFSSFTLIGLFVGSLTTFAMLQFYRHTSKTATSAKEPFLQSSGSM